MPQPPFPQLVRNIRKGTCRRWSPLPEGEPGEGAELVVDLWKVDGALDRGGHTSVDSADLQAWAIVSCSFELRLRGRRRFATRAHVAADALPPALQNGHHIPSRDLGSSKISTPWSHVQIGRSYITGNGVFMPIKIFSRKIIIRDCSNSNIRIVCFT